MSTLRFLGRKLIYLALGLILGLVILAGMDAASTVVDHKRSLIGALAIISLGTLAAWVEVRVQNRRRRG